LFLSMRLKLLVARVRVPDLNLFGRRVEYRLGDVIGPLGQRVKHNFKRDHVFRRIKEGIYVIALDLLEAVSNARETVSPAFA
jgi:hypothetical protein